MSSYVETFENEPFHSNWKSLEEAINEIDVGDFTKEIKTDFARFKKVYSYISGIIENIDPELIPKTLFGQLNSNVLNCLSYLNSNLHSGNLTQLNNANTKLDNILNNIKPYTLYDKNIKRTLRESVSVYMSEIDKHLENIPNTEEEYTNAVAFREKIEEFHKSLFDGDEENEPLSSDIENFRDEISEKFDEIDSFYKKLLKDDEDEYIESIKTQILDEKEGIEESARLTKSILNEASSKVEELKGFYSKIFGESNEETGKLEGGLRQELDIRLQKLTEYEDEQKRKYKALIKEKTDELNEYETAQRVRHEKLFEHINSLIPGATSTGLALAYQERKKAYQNTIIFWNIVFMALVGCMIYGGYITLEKFDNWETTIKHLLQYSPIYIPAVWLAIYASKRRSESRGFEEEYAHKEALAKSYSSYKLQIEELGSEDKELMEKLLDRSIDTVSENPTNRVLNRKHGDSTPLMEMMKEIKEYLPSIGSLKK